MEPGQAAADVFCVRLPNDAEAAARYLLDDGALCPNLGAPLAWQSTKARELEVSSDFAVE